MNCEEAMHAFLNAREKGIVCGKAVQQHIGECEVCRKEVAETGQLFDAISKEEESTPPPSIRKAFEKALAEELALSPKTVASRNVIIPFRYLVTAAACALLVAGIGIGYQLKHTKDNRPLTGTFTANQTDSVTPAAYQSSSDRIEMINTSVETNAPDDTLLVTLTRILASDKNSNVRMAALYALTKYADDPYVHKHLVSSLAKETEPVIQVLLINLLMEKKGPGTIDAIQNLIKNVDTRKEVKTVAEKKLRLL